MDAETRKIIDNALKVRERRLDQSATEVLDEVMRDHHGAVLDFDSPDGSQIGQDSPFGALVREDFGGADQAAAIAQFVKRYGLRR
jgi:hypothetical protein